MMKKSMLITLVAMAALWVTGCGPSAEEQEKTKQEVLKIEAAHNAVDSTEKEVEKTSKELDSLMQQLNAQ
jgi:Pyruvate/2-oxoacid:ferredoxin oxidoreductase gamma subunit